MAEKYGRRGEERPSEEPYLGRKTRHRGGKGKVPRSTRPKCLGEDVDWPVTSGTGKGGGKMPEKLVRSSCGVSLTRRPKSYRAKVKKS